MSVIGIFIFGALLVQISIANSISGMTLISSLSRLYQHYDLILCTGNRSLEIVSDFRLQEFKLQQTLIVSNQLSSFVRMFSKERLNYGRTVLYLKPANLAELHDFVLEIGTLYIQNPRELYFDSRLRTFIRWPVPSPDAGKTSELLHEYAKLFPLNSEVFVAFQTIPEIWEIYSVGNVSFVKPLQTFCMRWRTNCLLQFLPLSTRRSNLEGALVKAISFAQDFDQITTTYSRVNGTLEFTGGVGVNILWDLRDMLNFSIKALESDNYILEGSNGTLGGMGAQLQNGEADVSIVGTYFLIYRLKYLTALFPMTDGKILAYFRQPGASTVRNIYSSAFSKSTWVAFGGTVLALLLSSFFFSWMGCEIHRDPHWWSEESGLWIISMICQKDWYCSPKTLSGKIVMLSTLFLALVSFTAYSGAMISALAYETVPVTSAKDLKDYGFNFLFDPLVYYSFFDTGPTSSASSWHSNVLKAQEHEYNGDTDAFERMLGGQNVFLATSDVFGLVYHSLKYEDSYICKSVAKVPFSKRTLQSAFFLPKGTPFKEVFNEKLLFLMEIGLIHRSKKILRQQEAECSDSCTTYRAHLGLEDVLTPFLILIVGFICSLVAFGIEKLIYESRKNEYRKYLTDYFIYS